MTNSAMTRASGAPGNADRRPEGPAEFLSAGGQRGGSRGGRVSVYWLTGGSPFSEGQRSFPNATPRHGLLVRVGVSVTVPEALTPVLHFLDGTKLPDAGRKPQTGRAAQSPHRPDGAKAFRVGAPTDIYKRFRNASEAGPAAAQALKTGYRALYEINESAHELSDKDLKGVVVQATGLEANSGTVKAIIGSFKAVKAAATFNGVAEEEPADDEEKELAAKPKVGTPPPPPHSTKLGLSYTINLNLPAAIAPTLRSSRAWSPRSRG